jgi:DNA-binding Xre family transcriptional regulator
MKKRLRLTEAIKLYNQNRPDGELRMTFDRLAAKIRKDESELSCKNRLQRYNNGRYKLVRHDDIDDICAILGVDRNFLFEVY